MIAASIVLFFGCGGEAEETGSPHTGTGGSGGGDGGPQIVCPVSDSGTFEDTPTGACTGVGSCAFQIDAVCRPGVTAIPSTPPVFECSCVSNQWQCAVVSGGLGLTLCGDAGVPG